MWGIQQGIKLDNKQIAYNLMLKQISLLTNIGIHYIAWRVYRVKKQNIFYNEDKAM